MLLCYLLFPLSYCLKWRYHDLWKKQKQKQNYVWYQVLLDCPLDILCLIGVREDNCGRVNHNGVYLGVCHFLVDVCGREVTILVVKAT